jgi:L-ascorbate metabolism protein UlaG (beta-lactamase superfamily)
MRRCGAGEQPTTAHPHLGCAEGDGGGLRGHEVPRSAGTGRHHGLSGFWRAWQAQAVDSLVWIGHATVCLDLDGRRVITDPVLRDGVGPLHRVGPVPPREAYRDPDLVLISHLHHDHADLPSLRLIDQQVPVVAPVGAAKLLRQRGGRVSVRELAPSETLTLAGLQVTATAARHDSTRLGSRTRAVPVGYLVTSSRQRVYFAGDTGWLPELSGLAGQVDVALLPVGGWGLTLGSDHLNPRQAAQLTALLRPALAVPIHWGTLFLRGGWRIAPRRSQEPGAAFARWCRQLAPATAVIVSPPGAVVRML